MERKKKKNERNVKGTKGRNQKGVREETKEGTKERKKQKFVSERTPRHSQIGNAEKKTKNKRKKKKHLPLKSTKIPREQKVTGTKERNQGSFWLPTSSRKVL